MTIRAKQLSSSRKRKKVMEQFISLQHRSRLQLWLTLVKKSSFWQGTFSSVVDWRSSAKGGPPLARWDGAVLR